MKHSLEMLSGSCWSPETQQADVYSTMESDPAEWTSFRLISWSFMTASFLGILPAIASLDKNTRGAVFLLLFFLFFFFFFWLAYCKFAYGLTQSCPLNHWLIDLRLHSLSRYPRACEGSIRDVADRGALRSGVAVTQHRGFGPAYNSARRFPGYLFYGFCFILLTVSFSKTV